MREPGFRKSLGRAIKSAREEQGLTQRDLAETAQIAEKYLSRIEVGLATPSSYVLLRLATALGVSLDELVSSVPKRVDPALAAILRLLRGSAPEDLEKIRRIVVELLR